MADDTEQLWTARLVSALDKHLDDHTKQMISMFVRQVATNVRKALAVGASAWLVRVTAGPAFHVAYAELLRKLDIPYEEPSPEFVDDFLNDVINAVVARARR